MLFFCMHTGVIRGTKRAYKRDNFTNYQKAYINIDSSKKKKKKHEFTSMYIPVELQ